MLYCLIGDSFEVPDWIYLPFFQLLTKVYEALRIINLGFPNYCLGHGLMDLAYNQYLTEYYTQIGITWRLCHGKSARKMFIHKLRCIKKTNQWAPRTSDFFWYIATNDLTSLQHFWWYDFFISNIPIFFHIWIRILEANDCENASFVQSETRMIILSNVNLRMYGIKSITSC